MPEDNTILLEVPETAILYEEESESGSDVFTYILKNMEDPECLTEEIQLLEED